ncbi:MAG: DUF2267 domain-containing protein [Deltaproteobacteria bacterium]|nr:DUF2267 domain-containing protein [Deltaproteobacteria bacterium]
MDYDHFIRTVMSLGDVPSSAEAADITSATLETLAERLSPKEAKNMATLLPKGIGKFLESATGAEAEEFEIDEFFERIRQRSGLKIDPLVHRVRAVTETIKEAVDPSELLEMYAELPYEFRQLFDAGPLQSSTSEISHT